MGGEEAILEKDKVEALFAGVQEVQDANIEFLDRLQARMGDKGQAWDEGKCIGDIFLTCVARFKATYATFVNGYDQCKLPPPSLSLSLFRSVVFNSQVIHIVSCSCENARLV